MNAPRADASPLPEEPLLVVFCFQNLGNDIAVCPSMSLPEFMNLERHNITYRSGKTISIIGATMFNIIATIIYIVFTKIGGILKHLQCYNNDMGFAPT